MNALDRVPQIRQDYANHVAYGAALGLAVQAAHASAIAAAGVVLLIAAGKKAWDWRHEGERVAECVGKTFATAALPAAVAALPWVQALTA